MNVGDIYELEGMKYEVIDVQEITYEDGSTSLAVSSNLVSK